MKWRRRYYRPWLYASLMMFVLSYIWHGVVLNDLTEISYSPVLFYFLSAIVYLFVGLVLTITITKLEIHKKKWVNGILIGSVSGFFIYLIAFVLGVSFSSNSALEHVVFDITWQMIEQSFGGMLVGYFYHVYREMDKAKAFQ